MTTLYMCACCINYVYLYAVWSEKINNNNMIIKYVRYQSKYMYMTMKSKISFIPNLSRSARNS